MVGQTPEPRVDVKKDSTINKIKMKITKAIIKFSSHLSILSSPPSSYSRLNLR